MRLRLPSPLPCAIALAAVLAVVGSRAASVPDGAVPDDRGEDRVVGTIGAPVTRGPHGFGAPLDLGDTVVWIWTGREVLPGQQVAVTGRLRTPRGLLDPGAPDRAAQLASRGARWELTASHVEVVADEPTWRDRTWRWATATQEQWAGAIHRDDEPASAALAGIVTGDRGDVPDALDRRWRACGIYHVLSVSGLHLAVVAGLFAALLRRLIAASPWGGRIRPARWAAPPALAAAIAYTMITGAQLATVRALVVIAIVLIAQALDRPIRLVDALGVAAIAILAWRPDDVRDPSFQLSFAAALVLAAQVRAPRRPGVVGWIARGFATSAWIALVTAPLTAYHFHQVQPGGVLGNLVLTPALELVALPLALAGAIVGCGPAIDVAVWIVARVDELAALLAHGVPVGTIAVASAPMMAALVAISLVLATRRVRGRAAVALWLALCALWALARTPPPSGALRVTFLDVGQGTATLVELPDGAAWLVDSGGLASAPDLAVASSPGRAIAGTLAAYGHARIDLAIVSHPHPDHYLGLLGLELPIDELWSADERELPAAPHARGAIPSFADVAGELAARGTRLVHPPLGVARREAGVELVVWAPRYVAADGAPAVEGADPVRTVNDNSLVVAIRYAGRTIVLPGDIEAEGEDALVAAGLPHVDVVAVPHHGSPTSSSPALVAATRPELAVISCGVANHFGFPSPQVVARWRAAGAAVERTDVSGAITVTIDDAGDLALARFAPGAP
ncbi:MAG TPA: ComEC/Rec2 family competence protein [Kofleriaceae bacterium]|nr:ComEC/Rec2 family competence protein [Kofleriaceae bacterium]